MISGRRAIRGGNPLHRSGLLRTHVADPKPGDDDAWRFQELWVNRQPPLPRTPNCWEFSLLSNLGAADSGRPGADGPSHVQRRATALVSLRGLEGEALRDVEVVVFHKWDTTARAIESASPDEGTFTPGAPMQNSNQMSKDCLFFIENLLPAPDAPGDGSWTVTAGCITSRAQARTSPKPRWWCRWSNASWR